MGGRDDGRGIFSYRGFKNTHRCRVMENVYFATADGDFKPIGHVEEIDLTVESEESEELSRFMSQEPIEIAAEIEISEEFMKHVVYGGDRGRYNGHVLHRDGYLSGENGWL